MDKKYDLLTALDVCVDLIVTGQAITPEMGQKEKLVTDYAIEMGGSNSIFACQAAKLGLRTACVGKCGDDLFGRVVIDRLRESKIDLSYITVDSRLKTGLGIALVENNDRAILTYPETIIVQGLDAPLRALLPCSRHLHIGSYFLMEGLMPHYAGIVRMAREYGVTVSLDTNWDPHEVWDRGLFALLPYVDIFLPNENELRAITKMTDIDAAAVSLCANGAYVCVKRGGRGAALYGKDGKLAACPAMAVDVVDTIGAGDSFDAGFLYGYLNGMPLAQCLRYAVVCGSVSAGGRGGIAAQPDAAALHGYAADLGITFSTPLE